MSIWDVPVPGEILYAVGPLPSYLMCRWDPPACILWEPVGHLVVGRVPCSSLGPLPGCGAHGCSVIPSIV